MGSYYDEKETYYDTKFNVGDIVFVATKGYIGLTKDDVYQVCAVKGGSYGQLVSLRDIKGDAFDYFKQFPNLKFGKFVNSNSVYKARNFGLLIPITNLLKDTTLVEDKKEENPNDVVLVTNSLKNVNQILFRGTEAEAREYVEKSLSFTATKKLFMFKLNTVASVKPTPIDWETI